MSNTTNRRAASNVQRAASDTDARAMVAGKHYHPVLQRVVGAPDDAAPASRIVGRGSIYRDRGDALADAYLLRGPGISRLDAHRYYASSAEPCYEQCHRLILAGTTRADAAMYDLLAYSVRHFGFWYSGAQVASLVTATDAGVGASYPASACGCAFDPSCRVVAYATIAYAPHAQSLVIVAMHACGSFIPTDPTEQT